MSMIKKIHVEEGQSIKEGAELVEFDSIPPIRSPIEGLVTYIAYKVNEIAFPQMNILIVIEIFKTINNEEKTTIVLVTHDIEFANYASRKIILVDGEVV
jgi:uncharacterized LabA/DUF88 family protein